MGGHHDCLLSARRVGARKHHADVHDLHRLGDALAVRLRGEAVLERLEPRPLRDGRELAGQPLASRHDPPPRPLRARQGVPGAESGQMLHGRLHARRVDALHHGLHPRVAALLRQDGRREQHQDGQELHRFLRQSR